MSSSSTWWSIRVSASQLPIKLSEIVNARGPSLDEFPAEPEVVASVVDCRGGSVATVGRLTAGRRDATVGRLTTKRVSATTVGRLTAGRRDATVGRLISATSLVATVGRLTTKRVSAAIVGRLTTGRRDATVGRLISTTSVAATVGRLTTKFGRKDDAPPVPSAASSRLGPSTEVTNRSWYDLRPLYRVTTNVVVYKDENERRTDLCM